MSNTSIALTLLSFLVLWSGARFISGFWWRRMKMLTVIDGDTFVMMSANGNKFRVRLAGVDCPELHQPLGPEARDYVKSLGHAQWVQVRLIGRDRYRRHLGYVKIGAKDLGRALIQAGLAYPLEKGPLGYRFSSMGARLRMKGIHRPDQWFRKKPWQARRTGNWWRQVRRLLRKRSR